MSPAGLTFAQAVAVDANYDAWFGSQGNVMRVAADGTATSFACGCTASGLAIDPSGNIWITHYEQSSVDELSATGAMLQQFDSTTGITSPQSVAVDGAGNVWIANYHGKSIAGFAGAPAGIPSSPITLPNGFGPDSSLTNPFGIAIDASGNLWTSSFADSTVTEFVGLAAPVKAPMLGPPQQP